MDWIINNASHLAISAFTLGAMALIGWTFDRRVKERLAADELMRAAERNTEQASRRAFDAMVDDAMGEVDAKLAFARLALKVADEVISASAEEQTEPRRVVQLRPVPT